MTQVVLSTEDYLRAGRVGFLRHRTAMRNALTVRSRRPTWQEEIESAGSELAVANLLGLPWTGEDWLWSPENRVAPVDVGEHIEVKWAANPRRARLRFQSGWDDPDRFYFLVTGSTPVYDVLGYLRGHEAVRVGQEVVYPERTITEVRPELLRPVDVALRAAA